MRSMRTDDACVMDQKRWCSPPRAERNPSPKNEAERWPYRLDSPGIAHHARPLLRPVSAQTPTDIRENSDPEAASVGEARVALRPTPSYSAARPARFSSSDWPIVPIGPRLVRPSTSDHHAE